MVGWIIQQLYRIIVDIFYDYLTIITCYYLDEQSIWTWSNQLPPDMSEVIPPPSGPPWCCSVLDVEPWADRMASPSCYWWMGYESYNHIISYMYTYIYIYIHMHIYIYTYAYIYTHVYIIYTYVCIHCRYWLDIIWIIWIYIYILIYHDV